VPFAERGGAPRGLIDLAAGRYPSFLFGAQVGDLLPVFHFHEVTRADLESKLAYLAENGYRTVNADQVAAYARGAARLDDRSVVLCFDDAWASLWTVAAPLLNRFGLTAITYAIPSRIGEAATVRPTLEANSSAEGSGGSLFVTWPELRALSRSGIIDVQCHTETHSMIFCSGAISGFVTPEYRDTPLLNRPRLADRPHLRFLSAEELGAPLYVARSRMSEARRVPVSLDLHQRLVDHVAHEGGPAFFDRADWSAVLRRLAGAGAIDRPEGEAERRRAIEEELDRGRTSLNSCLGIRTVRHVCLPWGVSSRDTADTLQRLDYQSAFANRWSGTLAVRPGDDPFWLKRLPNRYIFRLPGRGRRLWG
jgi:peptidoglycan/xylan/chitin deacetylase (PgdA/CDA1 family)